MLNASPPPPGALVTVPNQPVEVLVPVPTTASLVPTPNLNEAFAEFRSKLEAALSVPADLWPPGRKVTFEVQVALIPIGVRATVENT